MEHYVEPTLASVAPSVERLVAAGRLPPIPMHQLYFAVTGAVTGLIQGPLARRIGRPATADPAAVAEVLARLAMGGTLPTPERGPAPGRAS